MRSPMAAVVQFVIRWLRVMKYLYVLYVKTRDEFKIQNYLSKKLGGALFNVFFVTYEYY